MSAYGRAVLNGAIDHAVANFTFRDGPIATVIASRVTQSKVRSIDITAQNAYVQGDLMNKSVSIHRRLMNEYKGAKYRQESVVENIYIPMAEPLMLELQHFLSCIRDNHAPLVSVDDGLRAMQFAAQIGDLVRRTFNPTWQPAPADPQRAVSEG